MRIRARIRLLSNSEMGRKNPIWDGYKPDLVFDESRSLHELIDDKGYHMIPNSELHVQGMFDLQSKKFRAGDSFICNIFISDSKAALFPLRKDMSFYMREGPWVVGQGQVLGLSEDTQE